MTAANQKSGHEDAITDDRKNNYDRTRYAVANGL